MESDWLFGAQLLTQEQERRIEQAEFRKLVWSHLVGAVGLLLLLPVAIYPERAPLAAVIAATVVIGCLALMVRIVMKDVIRDILEGGQK